MSGTRGGHVCVRLTREERMLIDERFMISGELRCQMRNDSVHPVDVWMTVEEAEELRDQAGDLFQTIGFGEERGITAEGAILDRLIDRLLV